MQRSQSSGRSDDNIETLRNRLNQYKQEQLPIIQRYTEQGLVKTINGDQDIDTVYESVKQAMTGYI